MAFSSTDLSTIYSLLENALSQDEAVRKPAEATLSSCESMPGFCSILLEIVAAKDLDAQNSSRWLASVYLKNSINRYWRQKRGSGSINDSEKIYLRDKILELIREDNYQVAVQLSLIISKIARFDYPKDWSDLFTNLVQKLQTHDFVVIQRVYMILNQILKELSTKRLASDQRNFVEITSQLFDYTWYHWLEDSQTLVKDFTSFLETGILSPEIRLIYERWLLCLKALRRMLEYGFPSDAKSVQEVPAVKQVSPHILQEIQFFLGFRSALPANHPMCAFLNKACLKLIKALVQVQCIHPFTFTDNVVLPPVLNFCYQMVTEPQIYGDSLEQFLIQCMIFIQNVLQCKEYKVLGMGRVVGQATVTIAQAKEAMAKRAEAMLKSLLDEGHVLLLCDMLIRRYLRLTPIDLEEWANDPEAFYHEQDMVQWKEKLRPCAESLFLILFENYREILAPLVVRILKQASDECPSVAPNAEVEITEKYLYKEAVYNAAGVANYDLYHSIDFEAWYHNTLSKDISNRQPNSRILRRRVAWLLGQWVSKIAGAIRQPVYLDLLNLLGDGDLAVQLAACRSLHHLIDDVHFYENDFVAYVPRCLELLFQFMTQAHEFDSKLQILNLVSLIIDRLGERILPCTKSLMIFFPQVWQEASGQSLLRIQVMVALQRLICALGSKSPVCYDFLFPVLEYSTNANQPDELNMLEDGLQLWQATLKHAPKIAPQLLTLFPHLASIMERNLDHLQVAMKVIESYILLSGVEFLQMHLMLVVKILDLVIGNVNEKGMMCTLPIVDMLIQGFPNDVPALLEGILQKLLIIVIKGSSEADVVRATAGSILARLFVQNMQFFAQWICQPSLMLAIGQDDTCHNALLLFFDAWLDKVDSLNSFSKKQVCAASLCLLLAVNEPQVLDRLEHIISCCTSVLHQMDEGQNTIEQVHEFSLHHDNASAVSNESEESRKRQMLMADPIGKLSLASLLQQKLQACSALHGEAAFNTALSRLHPALLHQLQELLGR